MVESESRSNVWMPDNEYWKACWLSLRTILCDKTTKASGA